MSIYYVIQDGGGGDLPDLLQYYMGGLPDLLQYYSFERKIEGYKTFSALDKVKGHHFILFNARPDYYDIT